MDFALFTHPASLRRQDGSPRFLALIGLTSVALGLSISIVGAVMPEVARDLQLSDFQAGLSQSIFFLGHIIGIFFVGACMRVWSPRRLLLLSMTCTLLGVSTCAIGRFPHLLLGRSLAGFGLSASVVVISQLAIQELSGKAGRFLSGFHAAIALSAAAGLFAAPTLSAQLGSWQSTVGTVAAICSLPLMVLGSITLPAWKRYPADALQNTPALRGSWPALIPLVFIVAAYVSTEQIVTVFLPLALSETISSTSAASIAALFWGGVIVGRVLGMFVGSRQAERRLLIGGGLTMSFALLLSAAVSGSWSIGLLALIAGIGGGPLVPLGFAQAARESVPQAHGVLACQLACFAGGFVGPSALGVVASQANLSMGLIAGFALAPSLACGLLLARGFAERFKPLWATPPQLPVLRMRK